MKEGVAAVCAGTGDCVLLQRPQLLAAGLPQLQVSRLLFIFSHLDPPVPEAGTAGRALLLDSISYPV